MAVRVGHTDVEIVLVIVLPYVFVSPGMVSVMVSVAPAYVSHSHPCVENDGINVRRYLVQ